MSVNVPPPQNLPHDESLAVAMRDHEDQASYAALRVRHTRSILAYTHSRVFNRSDAEDVAQDVWVKVWICRDQFTEQGENSFRRWLFTIACRTCIDANRRKRPDSIADEFVAEIGDERFQTPDWTVCLNERQRALEDCIAELPNLQQCVIRATLAGEKTGSAAEQCNCSAAQASTAKHHATQSLRDCTGRKGV